MVSFKFVVILFVSLIVEINMLDFNNGRIVGGQEAQVGQFPHHVSLFNEDDYICGGFIINQRWIGSAAQCTISVVDPLNLNLLYGTVSLSAEMSNKANVIVNHMDYDSDKMQNDISLIKTVDQILFSETVKAVLFDISLVGGDIQAIVSGHGSVEEGEAQSDILIYITKNTIQNDICIDLLDPSRDGRIIDSSLCTFNPIGEGICDGDAGSALISDGAIIGIASWGEPCALNFPDVYTRVSSFIGWMLEEIRSNSVSK